MQARPTTYKGIAMRSRLEAKNAALLDDMGVKWEYEPRAFANQKGQYLPDFVLTTPVSGRSVYLEVKPTLTEAYGVMDRMEIILDSDPDAVLWIWVDRGDQFCFRGDDGEWQCLRRDEIVS